MRLIDRFHNGLPPAFRDLPRAAGSPICGNESRLSSGVSSLVAAPTVAPAFYVGWLATRRFSVRRPSAIAFGDICQRRRFRFFRGFLGWLLRTCLRSLARSARRRSRTLICASGALSAGADLASSLIFAPCAFELGFGAFLFCRPHRLFRYAAGFSSGAAFVGDAAFAALFSLACQPSFSSGSDFPNSVERNNHWRLGRRARASIFGSGGSPTAFNFGWRLEPCSSALGLFGHQSSDSGSSSAFTGASADMSASLRERRFPHALDAILPKVGDNSLNHIRGQ